MNRTDTLLCRFLALSLACLPLLEGCGTFAKRDAIVSAPPRSLPAPGKPGGGAYYKDDGPADTSGVDLEAIPDAVPRAEPLHRWANRPYEVLGRRYVPRTALGPFRQEGIGSWYGKKFHGQKTSIGETYDMFAMSAAHPTLPLPSYARVTNPANGRSVVVRINDRGPFHAGRIIDLSYAAAHRLGYIQNGSSRVIVEALLPGPADGNVQTLAAALSGETMPRTPTTSFPDTLAPAARPSAATALLPATTATFASTSPPRDGAALDALSKFLSETELPPQAQSAATANAAPFSQGAPETNASLFSQGIPETNASPFSQDISETNVPARFQSAAEADISFRKPQTDMPARGIFLQLGAFANAENAENMRARLLRELAWLASPIHIHTEVQLHRLRLGPYPNRAAAERISTRIQSELGYLPTIIEPQPCESCGQPSFPLE